MMSCPGNARRHDRPASIHAALYPHRKKLFPGTNSISWIFAAKTTASGLIALLVPFTFNLDQPYWAPLTVFIVSQPLQSGQVLAKRYMFSPWTRDTPVQADVVSIAPDVAGFVDEMRVKDNQFVHKGDILVVLDRERYSRALATARPMSWLSRRRWRCASTKPRGA
jgi:hypothetical protein